MEATAVHRGRESADPHQDEMGADWEGEGAAADNSHPGQKAGFTGDKHSWGTRLPLVNRVVTLGLPLWGYKTGELLHQLCAGPGAFQGHQASAPSASARPETSLRG